MMTYEDVHNYEHYFDNLLMAKIAHDAGVSVREMKTLSLWAYSNGYGSGNTSHENFTTLATKSFEIVEFYEAAECNVDEFEYWFNEINREVGKQEYISIYVILDDTLIDVFEGEYGINDQTDASVSIHQIDEGVIIVHDENYGEPLWSGVLKVLYESRDKVLNQQQKEANHLEMAT